MILVVFNNFEYRLSPGKMVSTCNDTSGRWLYASPLTVIKYYFQFLFNNVYKLCVYSIYDYWTPSELGIMLGAVNTEMNKIWTMYWRNHSQYIYIEEKSVVSAITGALHTSMETQMKNELISELIFLFWGYKLTYHESWFLQNAKEIPQTKQDTLY